MSSLNIRTENTVNTFTPRVFGVAGGTYNSTPNFGAGTTPTGNLDNLEITDNSNSLLFPTIVKFIRNNFASSFICNIVLNNSIASSLASSDELRITNKNGNGFPPALNIDFPFFSVNLKF